MYEIIVSIIDLMIQFITGIFNLEVTWRDGESIKIGVLVTAFVSFVLALYLILKALGIINEGDD